jgi:hypothetical protein
MSAFSHTEIASVLPEQVGGIWGRHKDVCPYCRTELRSIPVEIELVIPDSDARSDTSELYICRACGWWIERRDVYGCFGRAHLQANFYAEQSRGDWHGRGYGVTGALRHLDLMDVSVPVDEIRSHLMANWDSRFSVHPRKFEEVVQRVMKSLGYEARLTAYSNDGGIDVVLDGPNDTTVGIQVKRWQRKISVEQIRSFVGALCLGGHKKGIFVTNSHYQRGVSKLVETAQQKSVFVELMDSSRFFEALQIAQISTSTDYADDIRERLKKAEFSAYSFLWADDGCCSNSEATWSLIPVDKCGRELSTRGLSAHV